MARPHPALIELAADRPLPGVDDAGALVRSAREHRMQGLLWHAVGGGGLALPKTSVAELARDHLACRAHHRRLWRVLEDVTAGLAVIGVEVASFKGVTAEARWYPGPGTRPCNDLDLMIDPRQVDRVSDVARVLQPGVAFPHLDVLVGSGVLQSVDLIAQGVEVDLHVDLLKFEVPTRQRELVWSRTLEIAAPGGGTVRVLDPETALVHLLLHLNKDGFARLLGYADVARLLQRERLDWDRVDAFARGEGLATHVYASLDRVVTTLGLTRPPVPRPSGWRAEVWRRLWPERESLHGLGELTHLQHRQLWIPWTAQGRLPEALRWWVRRRLLPPRELLAYYLPETRGPYLWRLARGRLSRARSRREVTRDVRQAQATEAWTHPPRSL